MIILFIHIHPPTHKRTRALDVENLAPARVRDEDRHALALGGERVVADGPPPALPHLLFLGEGWVGEWVGGFRHRATTQPQYLSIHPSNPANQIK